MDSEYLYIFGVVGAVLLGLLLFCIGLGRVLNALEFPGDVAQIEQLRADVAKVKVGSNEDVIGQVTNWNQQIRSNQQYRKLWYGRLVVPQGWESVELIEIVDSGGD